MGISFQQREEEKLQLNKKLDGQLDVPFSTDVSNGVAKRNCVDLNYGGKDPRKRPKDAFVPKIVDSPSNPKQQMSPPSSQAGGFIIPHHFSMVFGVCRCLWVV